ncbi:MAG: LL-diaminopimelate aminotransferase [Clostridia bacterium]|nr:LL-diaminopimelate aminotransferase [Clostridia bacterium]
MLKPNRHYADLKDSFLFVEIADRSAAYEKAHPEQSLLRMGIGDVTLPICPAVISALHAAVEEQAHADSFHGYLPECGTPSLREAIAAHYARRGVRLNADEVFVSSGASDELGALLDLFDRDSAALVMEPAYPAYVDTNILAGRQILRLAANRGNGFLPMPDSVTTGDLIYLCSPNNPTGAAYTRSQLSEWIRFANATGAVILFDAAYEAYIEDADVPHSIFEIDGARTCAIEICSLSKTAGFTGMRLGYTIVPHELQREEMNLHSMWVRNRTTKTNGISYLLQKGAEAVFTPQGQTETQKQIAYYKENAAIWMETFDRLGLWYTGGKNAPYLWIECPNGMDSWQFFDLLLERIQVVGTPGAGFGASGEGFFRFSTFGSHVDTEAAAKRLLQLLG